MSGRLVSLKRPTLTSTLGKAPSCNGPRMALLWACFKPRTKCGHHPSHPVPLNLESVRFGSRFHLVWEATSTKSKRVPMNNWLGQHDRQLKSNCVKGPDHCSPNHGHKQNRAHHSPPETSSNQEETQLKVAQKETC